MLCFDSNQREIIGKGLESLKNDFVKNRDFFELGTFERETIEKKLIQIGNLKNRLNENVNLVPDVLDFSPAEKNLIFEGLEQAAKDFIKNRDLFEIGSIQREALEMNISRVSNLKESLKALDNKSSLDSIIDVAQQKSQAQSHMNEMHCKDDMTR